MNPHCWKQGRQLRVAAHSNEDVVKVPPLDEQVAYVFLAVAIGLQLALEIPKLAARRPHSELFSRQARGEPDQRLHGQQQMQSFCPVESADAGSAVQGAGQNSERVEAAKGLSHRSPAHTQSVRKICLDEAMSRHVASGEDA